MHIPTFILYFFTVGTPLTYLALLVFGRWCKDSNGELKRPVAIAIVFFSLGIAAIMAWHAAPVENDCSAPGPGIYNDC